jgi:uncharacterized protein
VTFASVLVKETREGATLAVRVVPRASRTGVAGVFGDGANAALRIALAAPPIEGKANAELIAYIADVLEIARSRVEVVAGKQSKNKIVRVRDMSAMEISAALARTLPDKCSRLP